MNSHIVTKIKHKPISKPPKVSIENYI